MIDNEARFEERGVAYYSDGSCNVALPAHLERPPHPDPLDILSLSSEAKISGEAIDQWPRADLSDPDRSRRAPPHRPQQVRA